MIISFRFLTATKLALLTCAAFLGTTSGAHAQSWAGCDREVWRAMTNQATLETRRQDLTNKRYIIKPDSVMQYSCFDQKIDRAHEQIGRVFSNGFQFVERRIDLLDGYSTNLDIYNLEDLTEHGSPETVTEEGDGYDIRPLPGHNYQINAAGALPYIAEPATGLNPTLSLVGLQPDSLETAISTALFPAYEAYIDGQFHHQVLAATTPLEFPIPELCQPMGLVWMAAKCKNFDGINIFYRLEELVGFDPREFPPNMPCEL